MFWTSISLVAVLITFSNVHSLSEAEPSKLLKTEEKPYGFEKPYESEKQKDLDEGSSKVPKRQEDNLIRPQSTEEPVHTNNGTDGQKQIDTVSLPYLPINVAPIEEPFSKLAANLIKNAAALEDAVFKKATLGNPFLRLLIENAGK